MWDHRIKRIGTGRNRVFRKRHLERGVLQRHRCAKCGFVIPAHLAELWDGMSPEEAVEEWQKLYRATAPTNLAD